MPGDRPDMLDVIRWHAEPVRAAHHRRVGFAIGLVAGIVVTLILSSATRAGTSPAARVIPASSFRAVEADPQESRTREQPKAPQPILDPATPTQSVERPAVAPTAELHVVSVAPVGSVAAARAHARSVLEAAQFECFDVLMARESNWNPAAYNASSGAYGIPQAVPGSKMAAYGADWRTNPVTQVRWGIAYVASRYGTACAALSHSYAVGWY